MVAQASQSEVPGLRHNLATTVCVSLAGQPLNKRGKVWCHAYTRGVLLQPGVLPNQIAPRHNQYYYGAVPNALADQPGDIFLFNNLLGLSLPLALTNQVLDLHECGLHIT